MNDRFKFRAWDEGTKTYFDNAMIETLAPISTWVKNGWVVEQCTGLKDKKGRLIYEGDIVKTTDSIGKVEWDKGGFWIICRKWVVPWNFFTSSRWEVVGNVHETPELIGGEK